jgi:glycosyltransferase involved in cell wall biosynthesis
MNGSERAEVCVIIPTYNEAGTIGDLIKALGGLAAHSR